MLDEYTPPPRREAPPALKNRIQQELLATSASSRFRVVLPIAAAVALVAGVAGAVAAQQLPGHHDTVVVEPAVSPTPHASKSPSSSPTAQPKVPRPMTKAEIAADKASCITPESLSGPVTRKGKLHVAHAMVERPISNGDDLPMSRRLVLTDKAGTFICVDGHFQTWSDQGQSDDVVINSQAGAWQQPVAGEGSTQTCRTRHDANVQTDVMLQVDPTKVKTVKVTIKLDGKTLAHSTVQVHDRWAYAPIEVVGAAAWKPFTVSVAAVGSGNKLAQIQPYAPGRSVTVTSLDLPVEHCR